MRNCYKCALAKYTKKRKQKKRECQCECILVSLCKAINMSKYKLYADDCSCRCLSLPSMNTVTELRPALTFVVRNTRTGDTRRRFPPAGSVKACIHERGILLGDDVQRTLEALGHWRHMAAARRDQLKPFVIFTWCSVRVLRLSVLDSVQTVRDFWYSFSRVLGLPMGYSWRVWPDL